MKKQLFDNYNRLLNCKHKQPYEIDITFIVNDFKSFIKEVEIDINSNEIVNFIIYGLLYDNKEIMYDVIDMYDWKLEPEQEDLLVGYVMEVLEELKNKYHILKQCKLIIPYGILNYKDRLIIETLICLDKK